MSQVFTFNVYFRILRITGICSSQLQNYPTKAEKLITNVLSLIWLFVYLISAIISTYNVRIEISKDIWIISMDCMEELTGVAFIVSLHVSSIVHRNSWTCILETLRALHVSAKTNRRMGRNLLRIFFHHILMWSLVVVELHYWYGSGCSGNPQSTFSKYLLFISYSIRYYWQFLMINLFWSISHILSDQYHQLDVFIQRVISSAMVRGKNDAQLKNSIRNIRFKYKILNLAIFNINKIFNSSLLLVLGLTICAALNSCCWSLYYLNSTRYADCRLENMILSMFVNPLYNMVQLMFLIMPCDKVERNGEHILRTCYLLQENVESSAVNNELLLLVKYLEKLSPKFIAGGMVALNRKIIPSIASFITSYVILFLQLKR